MNNFFDVIIIGFGPTGGTLASLLAKSNLSILLLEKEIYIHYHELFTLMMKL
jgi:flavin-dependent dehydrogenase